MKKFLLTILLAVGLLAPKAEAYTNKEIAAKGKAFRTILSGWDMSNNGGAVPYLCEGDIDVSLDPSTGYIKLSVSFDNTKISWADPIEMLIDVNGTTATIKYNAYVQPIGTGETERIGNTTYRKAVRQWFQMVTNKNVNGTYYYVGLIPRTFSYPTQNDTSGKQMTGTVSYDEANDTYTIDFGKFDLVYVHLVSYNAMAYYYDNNNDGSCNGTRYTSGNVNGLNYYNRDAVSRHQGMSFTFYSPNATITDTKYDYNGKTKSNATSRSYSANVTYDGSEFKITNWNNAGCPWYVDVVNNNFYATKENFSIYFEPDELYTELNPMEFGYGFTNTSDVTSLYALFYGTNFNSATYDIEGVRCHMDRDVLHKESNTNNWLDGNTNTTLLRIKSLEFDDYQIIQNPLFTNAGMSYKNYLENTKITFNPPLDIEYKHKVDLNISRFGYGHINNDDDNYLYVEGDIIPDKNSYFVKSYELYMIPGTVSSVSGSDFNNSEDGHTKGFCLEGFDYNGWDKVNPTSVTVDDNADENGKIHFQRVVSENTLIANGIKDDNKKYTFYIKTNYTDESGLEPTFHALTAYTQVPTGVEDILANGEVNDEDAPVLFYNMNGMLMDGNNLTPGLYIRRQGSSTSKVIIR